jgi:hypothetical protein
MFFAVSKKIFFFRTIFMARLGITNKLSIISIKYSIIYYVVSERKEKNNTSPLLPFMFKKSTTGLTAFIPETDCNQTAKGLSPYTTVVNFL